MLVASIGWSDGDSDYVELDENSPTSPANTPDLASHIRKLEAMHEVLEGELEAIAQPTMIFYHTDGIKIPELANAETNPPENHQDNGNTPPVNTQGYPPHSLTQPRVESGDTATQAREGRPTGHPTPRH